MEDARRLSRAGRNERLDYAEQLSRSWSRERESVLATLDIWRAWWRDVLRATSIPQERLPEARTAEAIEEAAACSSEQALRALRATQRAREHLLQNTNAQLALDVMMNRPARAGGILGAAASAGAGPAVGSDRESRERRPASSPRRPGMLPGGAGWRTAGRYDR